MLPGPVFNVELLTTARRKRYYALRVAFGALILLVIATNYSSFSRYQSGGISRQEIARFAHWSFGSMVALQVGAILAITPSLVAGVIANEKQRKTLHYLLASPLSSAEIVLGKLLARMLHLGVFLAVALPIISLLSLFGGVDPVQAMLAFGSSLTIAFFLASVSIYFSTVCKKVRDAIVASYAVELAWIVAPALMRATIGSQPEGWPSVVFQGVANGLYATTPWAAVEAMERANGPAGGLWTILAMMGLQLLAGGAIVAVAVNRLRPTFKNQEGSAGFRLFGSRFRLKSRLRLARRRPVGDRAMLWKELHTSRGSGLGQVIRLAVVGLTFVGLGAAAALMTLDCVGESWANASGTHTMFRRRDFNGFLRAYSTMISVVACLMAAVGGANSLASEREEDTWISLVATPLDGSEIVRAKLAGVLWKLRPAYLFLLYLWGLGLIAGALHPIAIVLEAAEVAIFTGFSAALGTFFSLGAKSAWKAQTLTIAVLLGLNGGYLILCCPIMWGPGGSGMMFVLAGVTPFIEAVSLAPPWDFGPFGYGEMTSYSGPPGMIGGIIAACFLGILGYLIAGFLLVDAAIHRFDDAAERPKRSFANPPARKRKPLPLD